MENLRSLYVKKPFDTLAYVYPYLPPKVKRERGKVYGNLTLIVFRNVTLIYAKNVI